MNLQDRIVDTFKRHVYDTVPETETTREYSKICTEEIVLAAKAILALVEEEKLSALKDR